MASNFRRTRGNPWSITTKWGYGFDLLPLVVNQSWLSLSLSHSRQPVQYGFCYFFLRIQHFIFIFLGPSLNHLYAYIHIQCIWVAVYLNYSACNLRHKSSSKIINAITSRSCGYSGSQSSWPFSTLHHIAREEQQASLKAFRLPMVNWVFLNHVVSRRFANNNVACSQGQKTTLD